MPKSSSANLQPSSFSAWMKRLACEKLATAAVSVISKQILRGIEAAAVKLIDHEGQELVIAEALARTD